MKNKTKNQVFIAHRRSVDGEIQNLWVHLSEVANLTGIFSSKIGLQKLGELVGLLHDVGKASFEFQQYISSATGLINSDEDDYVDATQ